VKRANAVALVENELLHGGDGGGSSHAYEFTDAETLIDDFFDEVQRVLRDRGVGLRVTRTEASRRSK
jgi:hypothetical protein